LALGRLNIAEPQSDPECDWPYPGLMVGMRDRDPARSISIGYS
jgi:hypothetical protein